VRYGLFLSAFTSEPRKPLDVARRAAAAGYDAVFVYDHLFPPGAPDRPSVEPFTLLAAAAAANPGVGVGVLVSRAGYRPLGILAKETASLSLLSGRVAILGLGLGDRFGRAEHAVAGLPFPPIEERTTLLEETALAMRTVFRGERWPGGTMTDRLDGPLLPVASADVWLGGTSARVARSAARAGNAWNGWGMSIEAFEERAAQLAVWAREVGRDPLEVPPTWAGIVLLGRDTADLTAQEERRVAAGGSLDIWRGTVDDLRRLRDRVIATGATWMVPLAAGTADRLDLIAQTLRS
jgi:alkanesulfonate monooxygenase SsuD/methylene tetrahydromethanopterin reductase-like flavin-dependent oxidoreductase (luciferase family)